MESKVILLVEDNATDEKLTLRALRNGQVPAEVEVARDGKEAHLRHAPAPTHALAVRG